MKYIYVEAPNQQQIDWGSNDDPRDLLIVGQEYEVEYVDEHSWHTKICLKDFPDLEFNSVSFEEVDD